MPTTIYHFASRFEDWMTKPSHGCPHECWRTLQSSDNIFMTEWVAIFRESGLRDDVSIASHQEACLKLVVLARARARELQVDMQVERAHQPASAKTVAPTTKSKVKPMPNMDKQVCFLKPDGCNNGGDCQYAHPRTNKRLRCGSETHSLQDCTRPCCQQASRSGKPKPVPKKEYSKAKVRTAGAQISKTQASSDTKNKGKGKPKGKDKKNKPSTKTGEVDFGNAENDMPEQEDTQELTEEPEEPEVYFADGQTSEREEDFGCMSDGSASECTECKASAFAPTARASPQTTLQPLHDIWEWRGPCCLVRVHRQVRRCL